MLKKLTNFSNVFSRFGDLVLAILVVCIIGLLIIPIRVISSACPISASLLGAAATVSTTCSAASAVSSRAA